MPVDTHLRLDGGEIQVLAALLPPTWRVSAMMVFSVAEKPARAVSAAAAGAVSAAPPRATGGNLAPMYQKSRS
jgi:hypothetical protein